MKTINNIAFCALLCGLLALSVMAAIIIFTLDIDLFPMSMKIAFVTFFCGLVFDATYKEDSK